MKIPQWIKEVWHGDCHSCKFRHCCNRSLSEVNTYCPYLSFGDCYLCKYFDVTDDEWFKRGCEVWCFGGCNDKFKRSWPKTIEWIKYRIGEAFRYR